MNEQSEEGGNIIGWRVDTGPSQIFKKNIDLPYAGVLWKFLRAEGKGGSLAVV